MINYKFKIVIFLLYKALIFILEQNVVLQ